MKYLNILKKILLYLMEKNYFSLYLKYKTKYLSLKKKLENQEQNGGAEEKKEVYLFKANWCPHCVHFLPSWEQLEKDHNKSYNFITYDSDKNEKEIKQWDIKGFPTIVVKQGDDALEYVGPNDYNSVLNFIKSV